ncbi:UNVERIFIED_CONTAM: cysteine peptidase family C39 domain-containing protein, partial [Bacteroidetes bacterium 56_B9]
PGNAEYAFDHGVLALTVLSRLHGLSVAPEEVRERSGGGLANVADILRCGRALGLKLRALTSDWSGLARLTLPGVAA